MTSGINKKGMSIAGSLITIILHDALKSENPWVPLPNIVEKLKSQFEHYTIESAGLAKEAGILPYS